jgi:DNA-cytosine methyltransferase
MTTADADKERAARLAHALNRIMEIPQEALASELGVSFTTVNAWANGKRAPRATHAQAIERRFELAVRDCNDLPSKFRASVALLHVAHGSPRLGNMDDPLDELFFILLSLKTSFRTYEETYRRLHEEFHPWEKLLEVEHEEVASRIKKGGLGTLKARAFVDIAWRLREDFGAVSLAKLREMEAPDAESYLMSLPGVGRKTARCVMMYSLGLDVVPVDTHTYRVAVRLGLVPTSRSTDAAHAAFDAATPKGLAYALHTNFVAHGREICLDPVPKCDACPAKSMCAFFEAHRASLRVASSAKSATAITPEMRDERGRPRAVDIYAGCGGLSLGLDMGGWDVAYALDWDKHACKTHEKNLASVVRCGDVREVKGSEIVEAAGGPVALVAGGPNCQGVSERGLRNPDDPRNFMFPEFLRLVRELSPPAFLMENVPGLAHRHNFGLLRSILDAFEQLGYRCAGDVLLAADYGVPQLRYRFVIVGTRGDEELTLPAPTHRAAPRGDLFTFPYVTVGDAIGDLPKIAASRQREGKQAYSSAPANRYQEAMREGSDAVWNHLCAATAQINLDRAADVHEGGNWKDIRPELLPDRFFACRMTDHSTTYARLRRDSPSFTITALFGNITAGAFTHPTQNRALSIREGARLQSFPDSFRFQGPRNSQYRQIGNAVPPLLAAAVGRHLLRVLGGEKPAGIVPRVTPELLRDPRGADALPVLTPRFKKLFGQATRWPRGWGDEPADPSERLTGNYMLKPEFWPEHLRDTRRKSHGRRPAADHDLGEEASDQVA